MSLDILLEIVSYLPSFRGSFLSKILNTFLKSLSVKFGSISLKASGWDLNKALALVPLIPPEDDSSKGITLSLYFLVKFDLCFRSNWSSSLPSLVPINTYTLLSGFSLK